MKKMMIMILLSVTVLCSAGCSAGKDMGAAEAVTASKVAEASTGEAVETGKADTSKENESLSSEEIRTLEEAQEPPAEPQHAVQEDGTAQEQEESAGHKAPEQKKQDVKQKNPQETDSSVEKKPSDRTEQEKHVLRLLEHRRWNAYMRSEGYVYSEKRNNLAKTHNCLVTFDLLSQKDKEKDDD